MPAQNLRKSFLSGQSLIIASQRSLAASASKRNTLCLSCSTVNSPNETCRPCWPHVSIPSSAEGLDQMQSSTSRLAAFEAVSVSSFATKAFRLLL